MRPDESDDPGDLAGFEPYDGPDHGCHCLCRMLHPAIDDVCLHSGQVKTTVMATWGGKAFPAKIPVCRPCAEELNAEDHDMESAR